MNSDHGNEFFELKIEDLFSILWKNKYIIILSVFIAGLVSISVSLSIKDTYKSSALLTVNEDKEKSSSISSSMQGISQLAGINFSSNGGQNESIIAVKILESKDFSKVLVKNEDLLVGIMAAKSFDKENQRLVINEEIYKSSDNTWIREVAYPFEPKPSYLEFYESFHKHVEIDLDQKTGLIEVSAIHISPNFAKKIIDITIRELNIISKDKDMRDSALAINYLSEESLSIKNNEVLISVSNLMESYLKTQMLSNVKEDYLVTFIDSPHIPIYKNYPNRMMLCIYGTILGFLIGVLIAFIKELIVYRKKS